MVNSSSGDHEGTGGERLIPQLSAGFFLFPIADEIGTTISGVRVLLKRLVMCIRSVLYA